MLSLLLPHFHSCLLNVSARAAGLARGPEISSYLPHVYCAFFLPFRRTVGYFFAPIWWQKLI